MSNAQEIVTSIEVNSSILTAGKGIGYFNELVGGPGLGGWGIHSGGSGIDGSGDVLGFASGIIFTLGSIAQDNGLSRLSSIIVGVRYQR